MTEGRMDPRREAAHAHAQALREEAELCGSAYEVVDATTLRSAADYLDSLPASPVSPPSADARAKLEQAVREWKEAKRDVRRVINSTEHHPEGTTYAAMQRLDAAEDALLALPPHEGETPQEDGAPTTAGLLARAESLLEAIADVLDGKETSDFMLSFPIVRQVYDWRLERGETPQPAAEPRGWRDKLSAAIMNMPAPVNHADPCASAYKLGYRDARHDAAELVAGLALPPVVQTRPEEPQPQQLAGNLAEVMRLADQVEALARKLQSDLHHSDWPQALDMILDAFRALALLQSQPVPAAEGKAR